jgi:hypothetical protein
LSLVMSVEESTCSNSKSTEAATHEEHQEVEKTNMLPVMLPNACVLRKRFTDAVESTTTTTLRSAQMS